MGENIPSAATKAALKIGKMCPGPPELNSHGKGQRKKGNANSEDKNLTGRKTLN